ncbi:hypothetical protein A5649_09760 [Mycolicibacter heraklionensis]|uniref:Uncharacterized protein n=1 Tax=Mycolicibacter heraklionensis TaxID=512402 RepID=A0AA91ERZ6_9MYCO|nr:hypothetical protein A5649_09760 [Mycolicibacter heraklionensis]
MLSGAWKAGNDRLRVSEERSSRGPRGLLDKQAHAPRYYGVPYVAGPDGQLRKLQDGPGQLSWEDGRVTFSMPRHGEQRHDGSLVRILYEDFPDNGPPIWHDTLVPVLDGIADYGGPSVPVETLRKGLRYHRNTP